MKNRFIYLMLFPVLFIACNQNPLAVDVSNVSVEITHENVVEAYKNGWKNGDLSTVNKTLSSKGGELYDYYTKEMLRVGMPMQDSTVAFLKLFLADSIMQIVHHKIESKFGDFHTEMEEISDMFKHLKYHIPNALLPVSVMTYNSTFTNGVISTPSRIGIGLEMYLGSEDEIVKEVPFPLYLKKRMNAEFLMADIAQNWIVSNVIEGVLDDTFLANLIYNGKMLYLIKAMMPNAENNIIMRYSKSDYEWAVASEYDVWQYIVQENWVYASELKLNMRFFKEGPNTSGLDGSPDRIGQFIGFKIIENYMEKYPETTLKSLIAEKNTTKILKTYKPKK
ncbi:hypothetical protein DNU06_12935 [Putridiphycobacter roseus]|uniref:Gliding motility protein GldB n=1 Tax=Putridiphycobacter roseus TaxID=2219161 RepID=A0A2W1MX82_9FLAO|nr:hypothetical protein [Putridiphycobacter roseus]PZE16447.1 hypothetical protein DNU06_12935 [Putridiphycobacter roseus]